MIYTLRILKSAINFLILWFLIIGVCYGQELVSVRAAYDKECEEYYNKGMEFAVQGKLQEAKEEFRKVLEIEPFHKLAKLSLLTIEDAFKQKIKTETVVNILKGVDYEKKGMWDVAIEEQNKAIANDPNYANNYNYRAALYTYKSMYDQAFSDYDKALEIDPMNVDAFNDRGIAYAMLGNFEHAISDLNKAIELDPNYKDPYYNRGTAFLLTGQTDQAISDFNKVLEINPKDVRAYLNRAVAYEKKGLYEQAISDCNKIIAIDPTQVTGYFNKALICEKTGKIEDAIEAYKGVIQHSSKEKDVLTAKIKIEELEQQQKLKHSDR